MEIKLCTECGNSLNSSQIKNNKKRCTLCIANKRIEYLISEEYTDAIFSKSWSKDIYLNYSEFLKDSRLSKEISSKNLKKVSDIFTEAEGYFDSPSTITRQWLDDTITKINSRKSCKPSLLSFLKNEGILSSQDENKRLDDAIQRQIIKIPNKFRRLIEVYYNEKKYLIKRQIEQNASKPLSLKTINTDIGIFLRLSKWIDEFYPEVDSWRVLQEEQVHTFLLSLPKINREIVRKNLHVLFKLAKRKKMITHIPIMDIPTREYPSNMEPLNISEQKDLAEKIKRNLHSNPLSCFLISLCFYHGLSSREISYIKIQDINLEGKCIYINGRPPVYLSHEDMLILQNYAKERLLIKNIDKKNYLFVSKAHSYEDKSVSKRFINKYVKELSGYTPLKLRISCFSALSTIYGPQYLIEAFGLSLTQSSRYGKFEDFLVGEDLKDQLSKFQEFKLELNNISN